MQIISDDLGWGQLRKNQYYLYNQFRLFAWQVNGIKGRKDTQQLLLHIGCRVVTDIRSKDVLETKTWWERWGIYVKCLWVVDSMEQRRNLALKTTVPHNTTVIRS